MGAVRKVVTKIKLYPEHPIPAPKTFLVCDRPDRTARAVSFAAIAVSPDFVLVYWSSDGMHLKARMKLGEIVEPSHRD